MMLHSKYRLSSPEQPDIYSLPAVKEKVFPVVAFNNHRLRIWFDILTPKQVMFFKRAVHVLRQSGHEVLCTSREYREAVALARIKGLDLAIVGRHGGADRYGKLVAGAERIKELAGAVKTFEPDVALTFSSPEGARVAFGLGLPHIGFNDSPHADAVARLTVPLMSRLLCPWVIPYPAWTRFGISRRDIARYRALDPAAWLKHESPAGEKEEKKTVLIRLEESKASYIADKRLGSAALVDAAVDGLSKDADVVILCRYGDQIDYAKERYGQGARVIEEVVDGVALIKSADLFIGAGGTMSAEAALLGVPTISVAPVRFYVEDYLARSGLLLRTRDQRTLVRASKKMLSDAVYRMAVRKKAARALALMEDPTARMIGAIKSVRL
jgi:predicted glycosyltransferase